MEYLQGLSPVCQRRVTALDIAKAAGTDVGNLLLQLANRTSEVLRGNSTSSSHRRSRHFPASYVRTIFSTMAAGAGAFIKQIEVLRLVVANVGGSGNTA
jgi:hypothetical protein